MYKKASRHTGGSKFNGYARVASNWSIERRSADTPLARRLVNIFSDECEPLKAFHDYDLAILIVKLIQEGYTMNKWLGSVAPPIAERLDRYENRTRLTPYERRVAETVIPEIVERWADRFK